MQDRAKLAVNTTLADKLPVGGSNLGSNMFFKSNSVLSEENGDDKYSRSSPGCFPIKISNTTTPKLYTSHFSVTRIVKASSSTR